MSAKEGLHLRPAAMLVKTADRFYSTIKACRNGACVDAKSLMGVITLEARFGSKVVIEIEGDDAADAMAAIADLFLSRFDALRSDPASSKRSTTLPSTAKRAALDWELQADAAGTPRD